MQSFIGLPSVVPEILDGGSLKTQKPGPNRVTVAGLWAIFQMLPTQIGIPF